MPEDPQAQLRSDLWAMFHRLWTKAVGTDDYNKKEWQELERMITKLLPQRPPSR